MGCKLTWLGHGGWALDIDGHKLLLDPFLSDSPTAPCRPDELEAETILVSHGHFDHISDVPAIAQRTGAQCVAVFEVAVWLGKQGVNNTLGMNTGGSVDLPFGRVTLTPALHSSSFPDGSYAGCPGGFVLKLKAGTIYFACDTALFADMQLIGQLGIDLAVLPIGDLYTMAPGDTPQALEWLQPKKVAPAHYNTWPPIAQDAAQWAELVRSRTSVEPIVVEPGESFEL